MVTDIADEIEAKLAAAAQAAQEHAHTVARAEELRKLAAELSEEVASARLRAAEEHRDVERLEGLTLTRVVAALRGSREDRLARERAEADAARLKLATAEAKLAALHREQESVQARLRELDHAPAAYAAVLAEKEQQVMASGGTRGARLLELAEARGKVTEELREIEQADRAALAAGRALSQVRDALNSAAKWSTYDTFFGGGMISSTIKHGRLDRAADAAAHADRCLAMLRSELADLDAAQVTTPDLFRSRATRFFDIWVGTFFTDLAVHEQIREAQRGVAEATTQIDQIRTHLRQRAEAARQRLDQLEAERRDLLTEG